MGDIVTSDDYILKEVKGVLHEALDEFVRNYIDEAVEKFESELHLKRNELVLSVLNQIDLTTEVSLSDMSTNIHIVFKK